MRVRFVYRFQRRKKNRCVIYNIWSFFSLSVAVLFWNVLLRKRNHFFFYFKFTYDTTMDMVAKGGRLSKMILNLRPKAITHQCDLSFMCTKLIRAWVEFSMLTWFISTLLPTFCVHIFGFGWPNIWLTQNELLASKFNQFDLHIS